MRLIKYLFQYFYHYKWSFIIGLFFVVLSNVFGTFTPVFIRNLINEISASIQNPNPLNSSVYLIISKFIVYYLGFTLLSALFTFLMRQTIVVASRKIEFELKNDLYQQFQKMEITFFKTFKTGDLMSRIAEDIGRIREFIGPGYMYTINFISKLVITIYLMYQVHPKLTLYALLPLPLLSIFIYAINQKLYKNNLILQERLASLNSMAQESYSGIRIIKSFVLEQVLNKKFVDESLNYRHQALKIVRLDSLFMPVVTFLMSLSIIISIFAGGNFYIQKEINIGQLVEFLMYVNMLTWPVMSIGWVANIIQKANAALTRISDIMMQKTEPYLDHNAIHYDLKGDIEFKNVTFTYPETGIKALDGASFKIPFGQKWLIVGKTGSGKSTIAELLMKYYKIDSGEILINGINIENIPLEHVRQAFSYVPQEVFLFSDTVSNNISFGKENIEFEDIEMAAKNAQIASEINTLQNGFQTKVGERGITLSGGQKQRISIARGILKHAPFYLFDDCLSAVDVDTEYRLIESFNHIEKASLILITHRIFNQLSFDSVICMDNGKIVEMGSHEELIKLKGKYYELYQKQEIKTDYI